MKTTPTFVKALIRLIQTSLGHIKVHSDSFGTHSAAHMTCYDSFDSFETHSDTLKTHGDSAKTR